MENNLKRRVMSRIYIIYFKNLLVDKIAILILPIFATVSYMCVSLNNVLNNIPIDDLSGTFSFVLYAIRETELAMQIMFVAILVWLIIWSAKKTQILSRVFSRAISSSSPPTLD